VVLIAIFGSSLGAREEKLYNGLAALLAEHGGVFPMGEPIFGRIVGGNPTTIEQVPYIISMQRFGAHRCGGIILNPTKILTAAHCTVLIAANTLSIRAGSTFSQQDVGQLIQVALVINHPSYNPFTLNNDVSIMRLESALNFAPAGVGAIGMPVQGAGTAAGTMSRVSGWGAVCEGCAGSAQLQYVDVPIITNAECNSLYSGGITDGMICAGFTQGGRDACQGDSGGPLTAGNQVIGVVSWGQGCARPNFPGVYARVAHYRNWIDNN